MHYKRALRINHSSALIMCHIAVVSISLLPAINQILCVDFNINSHINKIYFNYVIIRVSLLQFIFLNRYKIAWKNLTKHYILYI